MVRQLTRRLPFVGSVRRECRFRDRVYPGTQ